jgi:protein ImuB
MWSGIVTQPVSGQRRFLALVFPFLAADLCRLMERRTRPERPAGASQAETPRVFTVKQQGAYRLHALDEKALALGLTPGMGLADARARVPALDARAHDAESEAEWMARLAHQCRHFTPMVAIDPPEGLVLDITGCAHLFGGERGLTRAAVSLMREHGMTVRHARATTPEAALALARFGEGRARDESRAVHALPLIALRQTPDIRLALRRAGFTTIGDLASLPAAPLAARFGVGLVDALDRLLGRTDSRIIPRRPLSAIRAERRFAEPIAHIDTVMMVMRDLLAEVCTTLAERHQGGRRFSAYICRSDGDVRALDVETGQGVRDPAIVLRLFEERIEALSDPLDPGFGYDMMRLAVPVVEAVDFPQQALDGDQAKDADLAALLDRLGVRAGARRFRRFAPRETHIPERVTGLSLAAHPHQAWDDPLPDEPPLRPLCLLDPPERIEVMAEVPDGPPRQFRWRRTMHRITAHEGPERIAPEWWRRPNGYADNPGLTRDYYRIEDESGRRFWIFRLGLYERETEAPDWYLHGFFS